MPIDIITPLTLDEIDEGIENATEWLQNETWFKASKIPAAADVLAEIEVQKSSRNCNWARAFVAALAKTWPGVNESIAVAIVLDILALQRPGDMAETIPAAADGSQDIRSLEATLRQVAPEFHNAIVDHSASPADILIRVVIGTLLQVEPKNPSEAFLVDAGARAHADLFEMDADEFVSLLLFDEEDPSQDAIGFAIVMSGTNGLREIWIKKPDERARDTVASLVKRIANQQGVSIQENLEKETLVVVAAKVICANTQDEEVLSAMLGVVCETLGANGLLIAVDPEAPSLEDLALDGAFHAIKGGNPMELRDLMRMHPAVQEFEQMYDLYEEVQSSFNDRLTAIGDRLNEMRPADDEGDVDEDDGSET